MEAIIDTGCTFGLAINQETWQKLGKPARSEKLLKALVADGSVEGFKFLDLKATLETLDVDIEIPIQAVIVPNLKTCLIGLPLLEQICRKSNTDFLINFRQGYWEIGTFSAGTTTDYLLKGKNGKELLKRIREHEAGED